jgi:hypothetical protein
MTRNPAQSGEARAAQAHEKVPAAARAGMACVLGAVVAYQQFGGGKCIAQCGFYVGRVDRVG